MEKFAKNLDFYDDPNKEVFKKRFPTMETIPQILKEGEFLSKDELKTLPDDAFALILRDGDRKLRKFACTDKANTAMSVIYFMDKAAKELPKAIKKTAAYNLVGACKLYDIAPPADLIKLAEVEEDKAPIGIDPMIEMPMEKDPADVKKEAEYCLPDKRRYPLDSYKQITTAISYFEKNANKFAPQDRRVYAHNLEKRASEVGIDLPEIARRYASDIPASSPHIKEQVALRMSKVAGTNMAGGYKILVEKKDLLPHETFVSALAEMDKIAGLEDMWDNTLEDPWKACYKVAADAGPYTFNDTVGYVTEKNLNTLAEYKELLTRAFDDDLVDEFKKAPVKTFEALPLDQKRVVIRLCNAVNSRF